MCSTTSACACAPAGLSKGLKYAPSPGAAPVPYQLDIIGFDAYFSFNYDDNFSTDRFIRFDVYFN